MKESLLGDDQGWGAGHTHEGFVSLKRPKEALSSFPHEDTCIQTRPRLCGHLNLSFPVSQLQNKSVRKRGKGYSKQAVAILTEAIKISLRRIPPQ